MLCLRDTGMWLSEVWHRMYLCSRGLLAQVQRLMSIRQQKEKARGQMTEIQKEVDHLGCKERPLLAQNSPSCE